MNNSYGNLIIISGPSGTGKGTLIKEILKRDDRLVLSISATTRKPREGERDGVDYNFINKEFFKDLIESNGLLEYAQYCDNFYGTPKKPVEEYRAKGKDVILEIEVQGAESLREICPDAISIFIAPPSIAELRQRLKLRGTEEGEIMERRLVKAAVEMTQSEKYDYIVINDVVDDCSSIILSIIEAERYKSSRMNKTIKDVLHNV